GSCFLMSKQGQYHDTEGHIEGPKDPGCLRVQPSGPYAGEYEVRYHGQMRSANMIVHCNSSVSQPGVLTDFQKYDPRNLNFHIADTPATQCLRKMPRSTVFIFNTQDPSKFECLQQDGMTKLLGSRYYASGQLFGDVEYHLIKTFSCAYEVLNGTNETVLTETINEIASDDDEVGDEEAEDLEAPEGQGEAEAFTAEDASEGTAEPAAAAESSEDDEDDKGDEGDEYDKGVEDDEDDEGDEGDEDDKGLRAGPMRWALAWLVAASAAHAAGWRGGGSTSLQVRLNRTYSALPRGRGGLPGASAVRYLARRYLRAEHGWVAKGLDLAPLGGRGNASALAARRASAVLRIPAGLPEEGRSALRAGLAEASEQGFTLEAAAGFVGALEQVLVDASISTLRRAIKIAAGLQVPGSMLQGALWIYGGLIKGGWELESQIIRAKDKDTMHERFTKSMRAWDREFQDMLERSVVKVVKHVSGKPGSMYEKALKGARLLQMQIAHFTAKQCSVFRSTLSKQDTRGTGQVRLAGAWGTTVHTWAVHETPEYLRSLGALAERGAYGGGPGLLIPNYVSSMSSCTEPAPRHVLVCCPDECEEEVLPRIEARAHGPRASPGSVWAAVRPLLKGSPAAAREALRSELRALDQGPNGTGVAVHGRPLGRWLHRAFPDRCRMPLATRPLVVDPALLPSAAHAAGRFVAVGADDVKGIKSHLEARWGTDRTGGNPASFAWRSHWTLQEEFVLLSGLLRARRKLRDPDDDDNDDEGPQVAEALEDALNVRVLAATAETGSVEHNLAYHLLAAVAAVGGSPVFSLSLRVMLRILSAIVNAVLLPVVAGLCWILSSIYRRTAAAIAATLSALAATWEALRRLGTAAASLLRRPDSAKTDPKPREARQGLSSKAPRDATQQQPQPQPRKPPAPAPAQPEQPARQLPQEPAAPQPQDPGGVASGADEEVPLPSQQAGAEAPQTRLEPAAASAPPASEPASEPEARANPSAKRSSWADMYDNENEPPCPAMWAATEPAEPPERPRGLQLVSALVRGEPSARRWQKPKAKPVPSPAPAHAPPAGAPLTGARAHFAPPTPPPSKPPSRGIGLVKGLLGSRPQQDTEPHSGLVHAAAPVAPPTAPPSDAPQLRALSPRFATSALRWRPQNSFGYIVGEKSANGEQTAAQEPWVAAGTVEAPAPAAAHGVSKGRWPDGSRVLPSPPLGPAPAAPAWDRKEADGNGEAGRGVGSVGGSRRAEQGSAAPKQAAITEARAASGDSLQDASHPLGAWFRRRVFELRVMVPMGPMELLGVLESLTDDQLAPPYAEAKMWLGLDESEPLPAALETLVAEFLARRGEGSPTASAGAAAGVDAGRAGAPAAIGRTGAASEGSPAEQQQSDEELAGALQPRVMEWRGRCRQVVQRPAGPNDLTAPPAAVGAGGAANTQADDHTPAGDLESRHTVAAERGELPGLPWWDALDLAGALREPVPTWTAVPDSLTAAAGDLLAAALKAVAAQPARGGAWTRLLLLPRLLFAIPPGGDDEQEAASATKVLTARIRQAWAGDWAGLWAATARPGDGDGGGRRPPDLAAQARRVHELLMLGEVSRAAAAAGGPGKLATGAGAGSQLTALFPPAGKAALVEVLGCLLRGEAPASAAQALLGGRLIPLQKPQGGVRPLACGETLRRMAAKAATTQHKEIIAQAVGPRQYGVGRRNGVELMHKVVAGAVEASPQRAVLSLDVANAFNEVDRDVVTREVTSRLPPLARLAAAWYGGNTTHGAHLSGAVTAAWGIVESTLGNATECAVAYGLVGSLKWGQRFDIQWRGGESLQARVAVAPCTPTDYQEVTSLAPSEKAEEDGRLWYMATPDGDVYPHELTVQALRIIVPYDMRDRRQLLNREGANPVGVGTYGRDWVMSPAAFALQLRFVLGQSLDEVLETAVVSAGAPEEPEAEARPAAARPPSGSALASAEIPSEWGLGRGRLPDPSPSRWRCIASSDGGGRGLLPDEDLDAFVLASGFGMAMKGGRTMLVRALPPDGGDELDARVLALRANATERFLGMREAVAELTETHWDFFPISGPRTVKWVCEFVRENDVTFRSRHAKFKAETGLSSSDQDVSVHELCCRIMHLLLTYDQLNGSELSCAELVCRRLQMAEYRHRERILTTSRGDELLEDSHLYLGTGETRGLVCISPKLLAFVTDELHKESLVLKERRKLKEERMASRGDDAHGGGGGGDGRARLSGMQSTVDRQKSEIEKLKKQLAGGPKSDPKGKGRGGAAAGGEGG
ncbi:unnamed protein product, partial [Prorocentrum cordatum]